MFIYRKIQAVGRTTDLRLSYGLISETGRHIVFSSCIVLMWPCSDVSRAASICIAYSSTLHNLIIYAVPLTSEGKFEIVAHILNTENSIRKKLAEKIIQMLRGENSTKSS